MEETAQAQQEKSPPESGLSRLSKAYSDTVTTVRSLWGTVVHRPWHSGDGPESPNSAGFARTARLALWAPMAVVASGITAALAAATTAWAAWLFWRPDRDTGKVLGIAVFASTYLLFLVAFASHPSLGRTTRRFWTFLSLLMLALGGIGLLFAIDVALWYLTGSSPFGWATSLTFSGH